MSAGVLTLLRGGKKVVYNCSVISLVVPFQLNLCLIGKKMNSSIGDGGGKTMTVRVVEK